MKVVSKPVPWHTILEREISSVKDKIEFWKQRIVDQGKEKRAPESLSYHPSSAPVAFMSVAHFQLDLATKHLAALENSLDGTPDISHPQVKQLVDEDDRGIWRGGNLTWTPGY